MKTKQDPFVLYKPMTERTVEELVTYTKRSDNLAKRARAELVRRADPA